MISKINRFHGRNSLNNVYKYGQTINLSQINLRYLTGTKAQPTRIAVVVSKKVNKSAVARNKIRRRIYEVLRLNLDQIKPSSSLIFNIYSDDIRTMSNDKLTDILKNILKKATLI